MIRRNGNFTFGIYAASACAYLDGRPTIGLPDRSKEIIQALDQLQGAAPDFLVRAYMNYEYDAGSKRAISDDQDARAALRYLTNGRKMDLVLSFKNENDPELTGWKEVIKKAISDFGPQIAKIQVTEEANASLAPVDGYYQGATEALVEGVVFAKAEVVKSGLHIDVGFNSAPDMDPGQQFWQRISELASDNFYRSLDYVGLDCFPDVFQPLEQVEDALHHLLRQFKRSNLKTAGIPEEIPLHITEHGWPTGVTRSEERQSEILERVIRTIHQHRKVFNITHYELFGLRDTNSQEDDMMNRFGIMRDDYAPKLAFHTYQKLIAELTEV